MEQRFYRILSTRLLTKQSVCQESSAKHIQRLIFQSWEQGVEKEFCAWLLSLDLHETVKAEVLYQMQEYVASN